MPVPLIAAGISAGVSAYQAHKQGQANKNALNLQAEQQKRQSALASEMSDFARQQHSMAEPALNKAAQHYWQLAQGNRGAINSALAPDRAALNETYSGGQKALESTTAAGPQRDRAMADLIRQRTGQLGLMPFQAKQQAYGGLEDMGKLRLGAAPTAYSSASSALNGASNTMNQLTDNRLGENNRGANQWNQIGENIGKVFLPYINQKWGNVNIFHPKSGSASLGGG